MKRFSIPTPFDIGAVNCYFIQFDSPTIIDPGPATADAFDTLTSSILQTGYELTDIDRVLITHPHIDHYGLAQRLADEAEAQVFAHENAAQILSNPRDYSQQRQVYYRELFTTIGVPSEAASTTLERLESSVQYGAAVQVSDELADGDLIDVGIELEAVSTPGHSPGSMSYVAATENAMFSGDHVLPNTTPNPFITLVPGSTSQRTRSLPAYINSLEKVLEIDAQIGYGGHGERIDDLHTRVQEIIAHHEQRKDRIASILSETQPATVYDILEVIFPDLSPVELFTGVSEVIGHLDLLADENRIKLRNQDGIQLYVMK